MNLVIKSSWLQFCSHFLQRKGIIPFNIQQSFGNLFVKVPMSENETLHFLNLWWKLVYKLKNKIEIGVFVRKLLAFKHWNSRSEKSKIRERKLGRNSYVWRNYRNSSNLQYSKQYWTKHNIEDFSGDKTCKIRTIPDKRLTGACLNVNNPLEDISLHFIRFSGDERLEGKASRKLWVDSVSIKRAK